VKLADLCLILFPDATFCNLTGLPPCLLGRVYCQLSYKELLVMSLHSWDACQSNYRRSVGTKTRFCICRTNTAVGICYFLNPYSGFVSGIRSRSAYVSAEN